MNAGVQDITVCAAIPSNRRSGAADVSSSNLQDIRGTNDLIYAHRSKCISTCKSSRWAWMLLSENRFQITSGCAGSVQAKILRHTHTQGTRKHGPWKRSELSAQQHGVCICAVPDGCLPQGARQSPRSACSTHLAPHPTAPPLPTPNKASINF